MNASVEDDAHYLDTVKDIIQVGLPELLVRQPAKGGGGGGNPNISNVVFLFVLTIFNVNRYVDRVVWRCQP